MDDEFGLTSKLNEDSIADNFDSEMVLLYGMEMNVEEPVETIGIGSKAGPIEESEGVIRDEEKKENDMEEVAGEVDPEEDVNIEGKCEQDLKEEMRYDESPKENAAVEENNDEDPEEEVRNEQNSKVEVNVEENDEEDPEVRNVENPKEEANIKEIDEEHQKEEVKNKADARNEGKLKVISPKKVRWLKKRSQMLKNRKLALRKKVKNVICASKPDEGGWIGNVKTEVISFPVIDKNNAPDRTGAIASVKNGLVDGVDNEDVISNQVKVNGVILADEEKKKHEMEKVGKEENTKEELQNVGGMRNEAKGKQKLEANSKKKITKLKKIGKKIKKGLGVINEAVVNHTENAESSKKEGKMKEKCMGMIFMCSSKTKKDCYHYQVLGFPSSKREMVFDIYEGMTLFLYDFDLKLMYGIYEAAGPGGYNIEPKAFNSAFPSQVRFSVREDCLPLAEEKFKKIIKDNYYSKNKFDYQLNSKQVEKLCELFRVASKGSTSKMLLGSQRVGASNVDHRRKWPPRGKKAKNPRREAHILLDRDFEQPHKHRKAENEQADAPRPVNHASKRPRKMRNPESLWEESFRHAGHEPKRPHRNRKAECSRAEAPAFVDRKFNRLGTSTRGETRPFVDPKPKQLRQSSRNETQHFLYSDKRHGGWEDERRRPLTRDHLYQEDPMAYQRECESPLEHPPPRQPLFLPLASSLPSLDRDVYRRDQVQYHDLRPLDVGLRRRDEFDSYGSYVASRGYSSYLEPSSSTAQSSQYYRLASRTPASTYHLSSVPAPDYQPLPSVYRYYP